jgi:iron(III) transport system substrate-binding protein
MGPEGAVMREVLTTGFQSKYPEIEVDYSGSLGSQVPPKLLTERRAGHYRVDLVIAGTTTLVSSLMRAGALDPMQPFLVGPDIQPAKWWRGRLEFADNAARYALVFGGYVKSPLGYNPGVVSLDNVKSWNDLLRPEWKGKMTARDPKTAGTGLAMFTFWYTTEGLGKEYIKRIMTQGIVFSNSDRQLLDWLVRGQYPVSLGLAENSAVPMMEAGLPIKFLPAEALKEKFYLTAGTGGTAVVNKAPHPNAAKVYLNYLLSTNGQLEFTKASATPSLRLDVPMDHLAIRAFPQKGVDYQLNYKEQYVDLRQEVVDFVTPLLIKP